MAERKPRKPTLQEALEVIRENGLSLASPDSLTKQKLHEESRELLGVKETPKKVRYGPAPKAREPKPPLEATLIFPHTIGAEVYGPGRVVVPAAKAYLIPLLQQQDQVAYRHQVETLTPRASRCYMIVEASGLNGARSMAVEVPEAVFEAPTLESGLIHSAVSPANADYYASLNRQAQGSQGRMF